MSNPNPSLAMTGSIFTLPLFVLGAILSFTGWLLLKISKKLQHN